MLIIMIVLAVAAAYSGTTWIVHAVQFARGRYGSGDDFIERHTFHLGLCFILSVGFLGLLLR